MRIAVCEDNAADMDAICGCIKEYCEKNCYESEIFRFESGEALLSRFGQETFNIVFLDVFLTGMSGVETARRIRETDPNCTLIFVTVSSDYALDSYSVGALSYVVKPVKQKSMEKALFMCRQEFIKSSRFIRVPVSRQNQIDIPLAGIQYIEVYGRDSLFHMSAGTITTRLPLAEIESMLGGSPFLRCHRCYIVNMNYVGDMREKEFLMLNGDIVPIRKNGRAETKLAVARFMTQSAV